MLLGQRREQELLAILATFNAIKKEKSKEEEKVKTPCSSRLKHYYYMICSALKIDTC
jgi:hypothetical protein